MTLSSSSPALTPAGPAHDENEGQDLVGQTVGGRYRITRVIGRGGMGVVLEALHEELGQTYAVKVLGSAFTQNETVVKRFLREARTVAKIGHPHIVSVHDLGRLADGRPFLVMELVHGRTLKDMVLEDGVVTPARVAQLFGGVADALEVVHARGIVHRDIKLENIMLAQQTDGPPIVKLLDFGVASISGGDRKDVRITQHGWLVGTPLYLPPEAGEGVPADARWDVYALGVVAYAMLTARWPFDGDGPMVVLTKKMTQEPPPLSAEGAFPAAVEAVIAQALAREPHRRFPSARAFVDALGRALRPPDETVTAEPLGRSPSPTAATPVFTPRKTMLPDRPWPWAAVAWAGAAVIVAVVAWFVAADRTGLGPLPILEIVAGSDPPPSPTASDAGGPSGGEQGRELGGGTASNGSGAGSAGAVVPAGAPGLAGGEAARGPPPGSASADAGAPDAALARASPDAAAAVVVRSPPPPASPAPSPPRAAPSPPSAAPIASARPGPNRAPVTSAVPADGPIPSGPARDPARAKALTARGMRALTEGQLGEAIELFREATLADDRFVPAWRALGPVNDRLRNEPEAAVAYRRYLALADGSEDPGTLARARQRLAEIGAQASP